MATFYFNSYSGESMNSQWLKHLQSSAYINDINDIISKNRREIESTIRSASSEQINAITQVFGKLDDGFAEVSNYLRDINSNISELRSEINEMAAMLDWKLSLLIEEQRLTNQLLGKIAQLLRIPDSQKQRVYHIEQGLKYLKNAILDEDINSSFYIDAMEGFVEAEKIERKDFVTLNRIGQIHLYSQKYLNIPLAQEYFLKSARESFAEYNAGGTTTANYLSPQQNHQQVFNENPFKVSTAESYLYASRCCYLQQNLTEAIQLAAKAYKLVPEFIEAGFEYAKYLSANNRDIEAAEILEKIINKDRLYSIKALNDQDLSNKAAIQAMLEFLKHKTIKIAKEELGKCTDIINSNSNAMQIINEIKLSISKDSYLSAMKAIDLLKANYSFQFYTYKKGGYGTINKSKVNNKQKLIDYIKCENTGPLECERIINEIKDEKSSEEAFSYGLGGGAIGLCAGIFNGCSLSNGTFSWNWAGFIVSFVLCAGIGLLIGYLIGQSYQPRFIETDYTKSK